MNTCWLYRYRIYFQPDFLLIVYICRTWYHLQDSIVVIDVAKCSYIVLFIISVKNFTEIWNLLMYFRYFDDLFEQFMSSSLCCLQNIWSSVNSAVFALTINRGLYFRWWKVEPCKNNKMVLRILRINRRAHYEFNIYRTKQEISVNKFIEYCML